MADIWNNNISIEVTVNITGSATLAYTLNPRTAFQLVDFRLNNGTSPATSEDLTVTLTALDDDAADAVIYRKDMLSVDDIYESWDNMKQVAGDKIAFAWNNNNTVTYKITIKYKRIN